GPERLDRVENGRQRVRAVAVRQRQHVAIRVRLRERLVHEVELELLVRREQLVERAVHGRVEDHAARGRQVQLSGEAELDRLVQADGLHLERDLDLVGGVEAPRVRLELRGPPRLQGEARAGRVVAAEQYVLGG